MDESNTAAPQAPEQGHEGPAEEHGGHPRFLAHHFETQKQQFDAGKLGMWIFLMTEILFFGGLFCGYAVYRVSYPEVFRDAAHYLDVWLGALNTAVLILSSLTIAWAVRCAQLGQRRALVALLSVTVVCACVFLSVKYVEYKQKWEHGLLWSGLFNPHEHPKHPGDVYGSTPEAKHKMVGAPVEPDPGPAGGDSAAAPAVPQASPGGATPDAPTAKEPPAGAKPGDGPPPEETAGSIAAAQADADRAFDQAVAAQAAKLAADEEQIRKQHLGTFFAIYFGMTGLHGIHVIAGIGVITWILIRAAKGHFGPDYFGPVDYTALYWHLVDMVWIYLFPLLYLIH